MMAKRSTLQANRPLTKANGQDHLRPASPMGSGPNGRRAPAVALALAVERHAVAAKRSAVGVCHDVYPWACRVSLSLVYVWFGVVKLMGLSQASALAAALTAKTVGTAHFDALFNGLAAFECVLGSLVLLPRATRFVLPLIAVHMAIVCAPLVIVPELTWQEAFVPTMEGQYIIKNVLVLSAIVTLAAQTRSRAATARG